jgi:hypothetical protein
VSLVRRWRAEREQLAFIAPNFQRAATQGLPRQEGELRPAAPGPPQVPVASVTGGAGPATAVVIPADAPASAAAGAGRFIERMAKGRGQVYELGAGPIVIGSSVRDCTLVLPEHPDVAPVHARMWLRDGKYTLSHGGGFRRSTLVGGTRIERCVLEHGDEVQIGPHRLVYEEDGNELLLRI